MYEIFFSAKFKKDFKRLKKQRRNIAKLTAALEKLALGEELPPSIMTISLSVITANIESAI